MLSTIQIKDYALIENLSIDFEKGFNIITGETGAGKSILIGALGLLLGERASTEVVRKGANKSFVEGVFDISENKSVRNFLKENDFDCSNQLILRREISLKGANRCFINDTPTQLVSIKEIGNLLVDLHGQHEHQSLLRSETHIEVLDEMDSEIKNLNNKYSEKKAILEKLISEYEKFKKLESEINDKRDLYEFQLKEINTISPTEKEDLKLEEELNILENAKELLEVTGGVYESLYEGENTLYDRFVEIKNRVSDLISFDSSFESTASEIEDIMERIKDIANYMRNYKDGIDLDPEKLETANERLSEINLLKKKYKKDITGLIEYRDNIENEFDVLDNYESKIEELETKINSARIECGKVAKALSELRKTTAKSVKQDIKEQLAYLGINNSNFVINFRIEEAENAFGNYITLEDKKIKINNSGIDEVEFYISTNLGEDPKPLTKVASGGEISRIMLALKSILAKNDKLPLLIFDEIDTGISGRIAQKVGKALKNLSKYHQIISITHLPQIAGLADYHYLITKQAIENRVVSSIKKLSYQERITEVAKLMSGEEITEASLKGAKELIDS